MHNTSEGDRIVISVDAQTASWDAEIDLYKGVFTKQGSSEPIAPAALKRLHTEAEAAFALGDYNYNEQHADGCVTFTLTLSGKTVTLSYASWGGCKYDRVPRIWKYALKTPDPSQSSSMS